MKEFLVWYVIPFFSFGLLIAICTELYFLHSLFGKKITKLKESIDSLQKEDTRKASHIYVDLIKHIEIQDEKIHEITRMLDRLTKLQCQTSDAVCLIMERMSKK